MTTGVISNYLENKFIDHVLRNTAYTSPGTVVYIALFTDATVQDDANSGTEVAAAGSYARKQCTVWDAPSAGHTQNTNVITFDTATGNWGNIRYIGIFDNATRGAGNLLFWGQLTADKQVDAGDTFSIAAGELDVTIGGAVSQYLAGAWLSHCLRNTAYSKPTNVLCALFTDNGTTEVSGGSYARQQIFDTTDWDAPVDGDTENTNIETYPVATANWGLVTWCALYDQGTNKLFEGALTANKQVNSGDTFRFLAGQLDVTVT